MKIPILKKISKRNLLILAVIIISALLIYNFFGKKKQATLQFTQVKKQDIKSIVSSAGNLTGKQVANLKFKSAGKLAYLNVSAGDLVSVGQTLAGLDTQDLAIALQQARNTLTDKQATVDKIHDDVKGHDSDETFTQRQTRTTAEAAANNAFDGVKAAQRAYQDAVIFAPISGIVTQATPIVGQTVSATDLIAQVVDNSSIYFDTDVDEADIGKISLDLPAEITLDAYPNQTFEGFVTQILPQTKLTSSGATVVTVRIEISMTPEIFVNGLSGQSDVIIQSSQNVLTIPQEALRADNSVVIQKDNLLEVRKVTTGISSDTEIEIKNGLFEGEKVLLNPPQKIK